MAPRIGPATVIGGIIVASRPCSSGGICTSVSDESVPRSPLLMKLYPLMMNLCPLLINMWVGGCTVGAEDRPQPSSAGSPASRTCSSSVCNSRGSKFHCVKSLRSSYTGFYPQTLHGVVFPDLHESVGMRPFRLRRRSGLNSESPKPETPSCCLFLMNMCRLWVAGAYRWRRG